MLILYITISDTIVLYFLMLETAAEIQIRALLIPTNFLKTFQGKTEYEYAML